MPEHIYYTNEDMKNDLATITRSINLSDFKPDIIVGVARGGLIPAVLLSHYYDIPMLSLNISLRDGKISSSTGMSDLIAHISEAKKVLIVEDICDSGATFHHIYSQLEEDFGEEVNWDANLKTATLWNNVGQDLFTCDYSAREINRMDDERWIIFPYEDWWQR